MKARIIFPAVVAIFLVMASCDLKPQSQNQAPQINQDEHEHNEARNTALRKLSVSVDKINSISDEITGALKEDHFHDIAMHSDEIRMEINVMFDNITALSNDDFTTLKDMLSDLRKSTDDLKHDAENNEHNNIHHTFDQFVRDFADLRIAMPKLPAQ